MIAHTPAPSPAPVDGALALIGRTPMVRVRRIDTGPCELFLKLESANPGGSIKDRIGLSMISAAEREGRLGPDRRHLVEATAGNTGLGLALVASQRGYRLTLVIPDKMSREKVLHLRALGAEVVMTRSDVGEGAPGVLPGPRRADRARGGRALREPVREPCQPGGARGHDRPGDRRAARRAARCDGLRRRIRRDDHRAVPPLRPRDARLRDGARGSRGVGARRLRRDRDGREGGELARRGHRRGLRAPDRRSLPRPEGLPDPRSREPRDRARALACGGHPRGLVHGHAPRGRAPLLSRAGPPEARVHPRLRLREQVPVEDVRRPLDARAGVLVPAGRRRSARIS